MQENNAIEVNTMGQIKNSTNKGKWKQLGEKERYQIEVLVGAGRSKAEIAQQMGYSRRTIERELKRGTVRQLTSEYDCADTGQRVHDIRASNKGWRLKIGHDHALAKRMTQLIVQEHYSLDVALARYRRETGKEGGICTKTLCHYIERGLLAGIELDNLPQKRRGTEKQARHRRVALTNTRGRSIEERPEEIALRITEGHWEGDTVVGKAGTKSCLFVLTERAKNLELIFKLKSKSQECVAAVFDHLERKLGSKRFREVFRSITFDNGSENLDMVGIERSLYTKQPRTTVYYAHPYSAWERGSNEVGNRLIRRFVPKGTDIGKLRVQDVKRIERWMNDYPRRKLHYRSAYEDSSFGDLFSMGRDN